MVFQPKTMPKSGKFQLSKIIYTSTRIGWRGRVVKNQRVVIINLYVGTPAPPGGIGHRSSHPAGAERTPRQTGGAPSHSPGCYRADRSVPPPLTPFSRGHNIGNNRSSISPQEPARRAKPHCQSPADGPPEGGQRGGGADRCHHRLGGLPWPLDAGSAAWPARGGGRGSRAAGQRVRRCPLVRRPAVHGVALLVGDPATPEEVAVDGAAPAALLTPPPAPHTTSRWWCI